MTDTFVDLAELDEWLISESLDKLSEDEKKRFDRVNATRIFPPKSHPAQTAFWDHPARFRGYIGGIASGKSLAGCYEALSQPAGSIGTIISPTYPMMRDATQRTFMEIAREHKVLASFQKGDGLAKLTNGSTVLFRTADDPDRLRGPNLGWFYLDEAALMDPDVWRIMIGRLRMKPGRAWATSTPQGYNWLFDTFVQTTDPDYWLVTSSTRDNPFLPDGYVRSLEQSYDSYWAAQEIEGQFIAVSSHSVFDAAYLRQLLETLDAPIKVYPEGEDGLCGILEVYEWPEDGVEYAIGADVAEGLKKSKSDESTAEVLRRDTGKQVASYYGKPDPKSFAVDLSNIAFTYNNAELNVENNSVGMVVVSYLEDFGARLWYSSSGSVNGEPDQDQRAGTRTTTRSKGLVDGELRSAIVDAAHNRPSIGIVSKRCVEQCIHYIHLPEGGRGGEGMWHDDHTRSLGLAWYIVKDGLSNDVWEPREQSWTPPYRAQYARASLSR